MITRYCLKYGDEYEDRQLWFQFKMVLDGSHGRRNLLIFRVFAALINELKLSECDEYRMINEIERWANERLQSAYHPRPVVRSPDEPESVGIDEEKNADNKIASRKSEKVKEEQPEPQTVSPGMADLFSGMKKISFKDIDDK